MPNWTPAYYSELRTQFRQLSEDLPERLSQVVSGRTTPVLDGLTIGSGRELVATVLFFDIEGSTNRTPTGQSRDLRVALTTLNCVIPMVSRVITDHGGYIEKNTGDGLMAVFGPSPTSTDDALDAAATCYCVLSEMVNPHLRAIGIQPVDARIGIDRGHILVARIGLPTGAANNQRNFLTAIGPAANIAFRLQEIAGTNGICVGEGVRLHASGTRSGAFEALLPPGPWPWILEGQPTKPYWVWRYAMQRHRPPSMLDLLGFP